MEENQREFRGPVEGIIETREVEDFFLKVIPSGNLVLVAFALVFDLEADRQTPDALDHRVQVVLTLEQATQLMKLLGAVLVDAES